MKLVIATNNKDKLKEIKDIISAMNLPEKVQVLSLPDYKNVPEVIEDGATLEANAIKKAQTIADFTGEIALADDTGLEVDALNGAPGVYSARFAGPGCNYKDNNKKLLTELQTYPDNKRIARFRCVIAVVVPGGKTYTAEGAVNGFIAKEMRGTDGFGYDPLFMITGLNKTYAELNLEEKNKISHRAIAVKKSKDILLELFSK
ncbi:MAG: non-canonical purine NTP pyrophosphatase, RdgB/HAM1 family [Elusimicrobia bacterium RIFOXYA2_FULL_39_19]|nr:MAG: non-canonical purine NTP pyrophosphatase, RdgB/HAM1 family [Elusimicrobia bacterium RIFOXYA2_FULL_39_19]